MTPVTYIKRWIAWRKQRPTYRASTPAEFTRFAIAYDNWMVDRPQRGR